MFMLKLTPKINCYLIRKILLSIRSQKIWESRDQEKQAKINPIEIRGLVGYSFLIESGSVFGDLLACNIVQ